MLRFGINRIFTGVRNYSNLSKKIYTPTHEWILECEKYKKIGISNEAVNQLNEIIYLEYNCEKGDNIEDEDQSELIVIESVKAVAHVNLPENSTIYELNHNLIDNLDQLNNDPECEDNSWIVKIEK